MRSKATTATGNLPLALYCDGNSITAGEQAEIDQPGSTYPNQLELMLRTAGIPATKFNYGVSGATTEECVAGVAGRDLRTFPSPYRRGMAVIWEGTNSIWFGGIAGHTLYTAQQIVDQYADWAALYRAENIPVIAVNVIDRIDFTAPNRLVFEEFNTLLAAQWSTFADGFFDAYSFFPDSSVSAWFRDGIHLTPAGLLRFAQSIFPTVQQVYSDLA